MILFKYLGLRARISSKLKSSGGCIIFEVDPVAGIELTAFAGSCATVAIPAFGVLVVGGALIVALLRTYIFFSISLELQCDLAPRNGSVYLYAGKVAFDCDIGL